MEYRHLGRSGLKVSRLCLGTMNFGPQTSEADSHRIMDRALEHGLNFFDTADGYGWEGGGGKRRTGPWAAVSPREAPVGTRRSSPPRSTGRWATGRTSPACRRSTSS